MTGRVVDSSTNSPLIGCNVIIPELDIGTATDIDGNYVILNIPPQYIKVNFSMIGYSDIIVENIKISIDQTTPLSIKLNIEAIEGKEIIVRDDRLIKKDLTNSEARINAEELEVMPVTDIGDVIKLQGGITQDADGGIHIRGGRSSEVMYMVDGVSMTDAYDGGLSVSVENSTIQELQVISGTFNAEYGRAMSGIVNMVTKDGSNNLEGSLRSFSGDHLSYDPIYNNLTKYDPFNHKNVEFQLSGPIISDKLFFFVSGRKYQSDGWLYGLNTFDMYGDTLETFRYNAMNWVDKYSVHSKITYRITPKTKLKLKYLLNREKSQSYDHNMQLVQSGRSIQYNIGDLIGLNFSHTFSAKSFIDINFSQQIKLFKSYLFEDPNDLRYITPDSLYNAHRLGSLPIDIEEGVNYFPSYSFSRWGVDLNQFQRKTISRQFKLDYTNQINLFNQIKAGIELQMHELEFDSYNILDNNYNDSIFTPYIPDLGDVFDQSGEVIPQLEDKNKLIFSDKLPSWVTHFHFNRTYYRSNPIEFSAFIQDKIEYGDMIINFGLRYDYFNPNSWVLTNPHEPYIQNPRDPHLDFLLDSLGIEGLLNINWSDTSHYVIDFESEDTLWYTYADYGDYADMLNGKWDEDEPFDDVNNNNIKDSDESFTDLSELRHKSGWYERTSIKSQMSPRFGIAYPISDRGVIHFSYGYFYQIPKFENLYRDSGYKLSEGSGSFGVFGNPDLQPQKTISYELGLQYGIGNKYKIDITGYFRDIRDWISTGLPIEIGGGAAYYTFVNKDYSNVRGILFSINRKFYNSISWNIDYTFQIVEGSNSEPEEAFGSLLSNNEPARSIVPLDWDQRHSLNASIFVGNQKWGTNLIMQYGSGYPYTPYFFNSNQNISMFSSKNSMRKRPTINFDIKAFRNFMFYNIKIRGIINIYNLFDRRNENHVWSDTGRSNQTNYENDAIESNKIYPEILRPNTIEEYFNHPENFHKPREIQIGMELRW